MPITTVIFDMDGTLLYTLEDLTDSTNYALEKFNYPKRTIEEVQSFVGNGVSMLIERAIPDGQTNPNFDKCLKFFREHYSNNMFNKTRPYNGIIELLQTLKSRGYKIAVASNKFDSAVKKLSKKYFGNLIDKSVGQNENTAPKPSADMVLKVISELGEKRENCIYAGDSEVDIQTAENAGIDCISVVWGYKDIDFLYKNGAITIIYFPEELLELI
ncbi:MAG: HAD family hydrolase [Candidatus Gastranaerophilales bacterium]|nr:HAD family hydrolase [Candidatus Gastranaerophilales bacterium]